MRIINLAVVVVLGLGGSVRSEETPPPRRTTNEDVALARTLLDKKAPEAIEEFRKMLKADPTLATRPTIVIDGRSAGLIIHTAAEYDHLEALKLSMECGADPRWRMRGVTALHICAENNATRCLKYLLDHGMAADDYGVEFDKHIPERQSFSRPETALDHAAGFGNVECVKILLAAGAEIEPAYVPPPVTKPTRDNSAWYWALRDVGRLRVGITRLAGPPLGRTRGNGAVIELLLEHGVDLQAPVENMGALEKAISLGSFEVATYLLENYNDQIGPLAANPARGSTAMQTLACRSVNESYGSTFEQWDEMRKTLLKYGAHLGPQGAGRPETPYDRAVRNTTIIGPIDPRVLAALKVPSK